MKKSTMQFYSFLNKHYNTLREAHPEDYRVDRWINDCINHTQKDKPLFICSRVYIHWSEGGPERLQDGQIFKSFFQFRNELIKRDLNHLEENGACAGYDKVKFSIIGIYLDPKTREIETGHITDRVDLGDGIYGIDEHIDILNFFKKRDICVIPTTYDLQNLAD